MASLADRQAALRVFLQAMPKGGDLHNHLGGAIYAEDMLRWAQAGGLCVTAAPTRIVPPPCRAPQSVPVGDITGDAGPYSRAIDALSTRNFELGVGDRAMSGADRFFGTFEDFQAAYDGNVDKALAIAREQAAADHLQYLELQIGASELQVGAGPLRQRLARDWAKGVAPDDFAGLLARIAPILPDAVKAGSAGLGDILARADEAQGCGTPAALPACRVKVRFQMAAMRIFAPADVFAQLAYGFALAGADPRVVGVNILAPEHDPVAVRDYRLHMAMLRFLRQRAPAVPLSLHAGELAFGMVPPRDLAFHIHDAVTVAGASRIGHGTDIAFEADATALLQRMARDRIAVEVALSSSAVILGVRGKAHPIALYRAAHVPVVLATDDEGVSRSDMTGEYLRAATEVGLDYRALKQIARDSLQYAFAPGQSLWREAAGGARVAACAGALAAAPCAAFAQASEKAAAQIALEEALVRFEQVFVPDLARTLHR